MLVGEMIRILIDYLVALSAVWLMLPAAAFVTAQGVWTALKGDCAWGENRVEVDKNMQFIRGSVYDVCVKMGTNLEKMPPHHVVAGAALFFLFVATTIAPWCVVLASLGKRSWQKSGARACGYGVFR